VAPAKVDPNVLRGYKSVVNTRIVPAIGGRFLAELDTDDIRYLHEWVGEAISPKTKKRYSTRSIEEAHNVLSGALEDALGGRKIPVNPCTLVAKPSVISGTHGALTAEQARAVLLAAVGCKDVMTTRWAAGLMLGGRQGELLGLQWDRVDLERGTLDLSWQLDWLPLKKGAKADDPDRFDVKAGFEYLPLWKGAALKRPKSKKSVRLIPIPDPLAAILTVYRTVAPANPWGLVWVTPPESTRYKVAKPVSDKDDLAAWKAAQLRAKIEKPVDVHAMRGTTATLLMEAGVDARIIQEILGHTSVTVTRGYQQVDLTASAKALGNLDALLQLG
jgi:integrase